MGVALWKAEKAYREAIECLDTVWYLTRRAANMRLLLNYARSGTLRPDWREHLVEPNYLAATRGNPAYDRYRDGDLRVITELKAMPRAGWEPLAAPDWRTALLAWRRALEDVVVDETSAVVRVYNDSPLHSRNDPHTGNLLATWSASYQFMHQSGTDLCDASYWAGLAAGGEDVDWRRQLRARVLDWPDPWPVRAQMLTNLDNPNWELDSRPLPHYWNPPETEQGQH